MSLTAIIVTFNRSKDLCRCIESVLNQSRRIDNLIIINNASTDDTINSLDKLFACKVPYNTEELIKISTINSISIYIYNFKKNTGGSGGFSKGMELAKEVLNSDFYWMMDDDGYPTIQCLETLMNQVSFHDYLMPVSIDINNHDCLSWATRKKNGVKTTVYNELKASWGFEMNFVTPFNGVLLTKKCVDEVGYVNKNFFIWGDEYEHWWRCREKKINPVTIMNAIFYHPSTKLPLIPIFFGLIKVPYVDSKLRMCCLARNYTYIYLHHDRKIKIIVKFFMYFWLFMITRKCDLQGFKLYCASVIDAFRNDFTRHYQYL